MLTQWDALLIMMFKTTFSIFFQKSFFRTQTTLRVMCKQFVIRQTSLWNNLLHTLLMLMMTLTVCFRQYESSIFVFASQISLSTISQFRRPSLCSAMILLRSRPSSAKQMTDREKQSTVAARVELFQCCCAIAVWEIAGVTSRVDAILSACLLIVANSFSVDSRNFFRFAIYVFTFSIALITSTALLRSFQAI